MPSQGWQQHRPCYPPVTSCAGTLAPHLQESPCEGNSLLLAAAELQAALAHQCVIPIRHGCDGVVDGGLPGSPAGVQGHLVEPEVWDVMVSWVNASQQVENLNDKRGML